MRRRTFAAGLTAALPAMVARAQAPARRTIGYIYSTSPAYMAPLIAATRNGLAEEGFVEGANLVLLSLSADGHYERLPAMAKELVERKVDVIFASGSTEPAKAAMAATSTIPIVFLSGADPVHAGIVKSLSRPGGMVTGVSLIGTALEAKRLEYLGRLVPGSGMLGALVNPATADADLQIDELRRGAEAIRRPLHIARAASRAAFDEAFAELLRQGVAGLSITQAPLFAGDPAPLVELAAKYRMPTIYSQRQFTSVGGLISYGTRFEDAYREAGLYLGKILKGARPMNLPVLQPTRFELIANLKTARVLGIAFPPDILAAADEVIE